MNEFNYLQVTSYQKKNAWVNGVEQSIKTECKKEIQFP